MYAHDENSSWGLIHQDLSDMLWKRRPLKGTFVSLVAVTMHGIKQ